MRLDDYIRRSIHRIPSLYKGRNYAESRLAVLNHLFLTLGNGLGFSACGKYFADPCLESLPYGVDVYQGPELQFDDPEDSQHNSFVPYPIFENSPIAGILAGHGNLEQDWIEGALDVAQEALRYYGDRQRYQCDIYFPTLRELFSSIDLYECGDDLEDFDFNPEDTILQHGIKCWVNFHAEAIQLLGDFLKKFGREVELPVPLAYDDLYKEIHGYLFAPNCLELYESIGPRNPHISILGGVDEDWFKRNRAIVVTPLKERLAALSAAS